MIRITALVVALLALSTLGFTASAQSPEDAQHAEAQSLVEAGLKDARAGNFAAAVARFDQALKLYPHPEIAHNLARAQQELGQLASAIATFKRALDMDASYTYAADARARITALDVTLRESHGVLTVRSTPDAVGVTILVDGKVFADHLMTPVTRYVPAGPYVLKGTKAAFLEAELTGEITQGAESAVDLVLRPVPKKGFITVTADAAGAEVFIDGERVGVTPLEGHAVAAGQHAIRISAEGRVDYKGSVDVAPNTEQRVSATLPTIEEVEAGDSSMGLIGGVLLGSAGGTAIIATTLWIFAANKAEDAKKYSAGMPDANGEAWEQSKASAEQLEAGAWVSAIATLGLLGTGITLLVLAPSDDAEASESTTWAPVIAPTQGGVAVGATVRF